MADLPTPDLLDRRGRMNRAVAALAAGVGLAVATCLGTYALAGADYERGNRGAAKLIFGLTFLAFLVGVSLTHAILVKREKRKWAAEARLPKARVR